MDTAKSRRKSSGIFGSKHCAKCGKLKDIKFFHKDATRPDGHKTRCKPCRVVDVYQAQLRKKMDENPLIRECTACSNLHANKNPEIVYCPKCR